MKFTPKQPVYESISFEDFVQHGRDVGANIVNGMPWSFEYKGHAVSHENDQHYLVTVKNSAATINFTPLDLLVTNDCGGVFVMTSIDFARFYEPAKMAASGVIQGAAQSYDEHRDREYQMNVRRTALDFAAQDARLSTSEARVLAAKVYETYLFGGPYIDASKLVACGLTAESITSGQLVQS